MSNRKAIKDQHPRGTPDEYDRDLELDNRGKSPLEAHRGLGADHVPTGTEPDPRDRAAGRQRDRVGQAESPVELGLDQPEKKRKAHRGR
ncbi:MAG TPA: hypothetical protein VFY16_08610 [Gemmatimonadaceae bacterium]|nr:hypothetical protein [Gemmatimonadaceae bacterium]